MGGLLQSQPRFLDTIVPYFFEFKDASRREYVWNDVALVQTPQHFSNLPPRDAFQQATPIVYKCLLYGHNGFGGWMFVGTNVLIREKQIGGSGGSLEPPGSLLTHLHTVHMAYSDCLPTRLNPLAERTCFSQVLIRRKALMGVGGFAYGSVTEDIHTGMRMHNQGWREFYYGEVMVQGEAPDTLTALMAQRIRWAVGPLQMLTIDNPLLVRPLGAYWSRRSWGLPPPPPPRATSTKSCVILSETKIYFVVHRVYPPPLQLPGLTTRQKINYLVACLYPSLRTFPIIVLLLIPLLSMATGLQPIDPGTWEYVTLFPMYLASLSLCYLAMPGRMTLVEFHDCWRAEISMFTVALAAFLQMVLKIKITFKVTSQMKASAVQIDKMAVPALLLLLSIVASTITIAVLGATGRLENVNFYTGVTQRSSPPPAFCTALREAPA
jgi:hypothetical protein